VTAHGAVHVGSLIEPIASRLPYMVTLGNHEFDHGSAKLPGWNESMEWCAPWGCTGYSEDSGGDCGLPYRRRFRMPEGDSSNTKGDGSKARRTAFEPSAKGLGPHRQRRALAEGAQLSATAQPGNLTNCSACTFEMQCKAADDPGDCHWCAMPVGHGGKSYCAANGTICRRGGTAMADHRRRLVDTQPAAATAHRTSKRPMGGFKSWYSVDVGALHLAVVTVEMDFTNGSAMHTWLSDDLENVDRSSASPQTLYLGPRNSFWARAQLYSLLELF
jgi:hypothetical protein